jgi:hypothetical protein
MLNAKEYNALEKLGLKVPIKKNVGIDDDINLLYWKKDINNTLSLKAIPFTTCICILT